MIDKLIKKLTRNQKILIVVTVDILLCLLTLWISFMIRYEKFIYPKSEYINVIIISVSLFIFSLLFFGVYKEVFRFVRTNSILLILKSLISYGFVFGFIVIFIKIDNVPRSIGIIHPVIAFLSITIIRILAAYLISGSAVKIKNYKLLIYGAGNAGIRYITSMNNSFEYDIVGFIDDQKDLENQMMNGYKIYHSSNIENVIKKHNISHILLAMPYLSLTERVKIINNIKIFNTKIVSLPSLDDLALGNLKINEINEINTNDLLGRVEVTSNHNLLSKNILSQNILVSGAGGSIGRELCFQIIKNKPSSLILIDHNELSMFNIFNDLEQINKEKHLEINIQPMLVSLMDFKSLENIFNTYKIDTVYHAAAYKHVDMVERNTISGIKNNVYGTLNICNCSENFKVKNFILVSSDKAVKSSNIMGATKRISELILVSKSNSAYTTFSMVRFGNVLNSSGSVIRLFREQISRGGPVTVRDKNATRYFMTIEEAATLVIQAGAMAEGGDIFILEMGKPIKIFDLARKMIELSGMKVNDNDNPNGDIKIEITKLKSGEKIHEELFLGENISKTIHPKILRAKEDNVEIKDFNNKLIDLEKYISENDLSKVKKLIYELV